VRVRAREESGGSRLSPGTPVAGVSPRVRARGEVARRNTARPGPGARADQRVEGMGTQPRA
jgi:hypothetical protein